MELTPACSPDGNQVAFSRHGKNGQDSGLFVAFSNTEKLLQLTKDGSDCCPAWSPDGQQIAFSRTSGGAFAIYIIPSFGGTERQFYTAPPHGDSFEEALSWSPDGKILAFSEWTGDRSRIRLLSLSDSAVRSFSSPPEAHIDRGPAFSPDGQSLAFVRAPGPVTGLAGDLFLSPLAGGEARQLTSDNRWIIGSPAWTHDSRELVFSSNRGGLNILWRIPASGGKPVPVSGVGPLAVQPSIPLRSDRLAYVHGVTNQNIWLLRLRSRAEAYRAPSMLIASRGSNALPQFSPDGTKIAFESERSGHDEIWFSNSDGSDPRAVTSFGATAGSPHW